LGCRFFFVAAGVFDAAGELFCFFREVEAARATFWRGISERGSRLVEEGVELAEGLTFFGEVNGGEIFELSECLFVEARDLWRGELWVVGRGWIESEVEMNEVFGVVVGEEEGGGLEGREGELLVLGGVEVGGGEEGLVVLGGALVFGDEEGAEGGVKAGEGEAGAVLEIGVGGALLAAALGSDLALGHPTESDEDDEGGRG